MNLHYQACLDRSMRVRSVLWAMVESLREQPSPGKARVFEVEQLATLGLELADALVEELERDPDAH